MTTLKHRLILVSPILVMAVMAAVAQGAGPIVKIAEKIEESSSRVGGNVFAVLPFTYSDGIKSIEGAIVSERLVEALSTRGFVKVVERSLLDKVLEE